jgi:tryptophan-rich hypothetical protein
VFDKTSKRHINPEKLPLSKWTAVTPRNKEKHFLVTQLVRTEEGLITACVIEAVLSKNAYQLDWQALQDTTHWLQGWQ